MKLYNTLTKQKEEFVPVHEGKVGMYVCGPTVYNYIHIGNARPMIVFDTVRRYFEYKGYDVNYVSNFTDVDDKIIKKANEEGVPASEISERFIAECKKDMEGLNIEPATHNPKATEEIDGMIAMISTLIEKGSQRRKANQHGYLLGEKAVRAGISNVPRCLRSISGTRLIFTQVERIWYSLIMRMRLHRVRPAMMRSLQITGCITHF